MNCKLHGVMHAIRNILMTKLFASRPEGVGFHILMGTSG